MKKEIQKLLEKSKEAQVVSEKLLNDHYFSDAASKAYYSMFYSAKALLRSKEIEVNKHSAVESKLGECFSKTGEIDPKFHRMLINARKVREQADYAIGEDIIESVATEKVKEAKSFYEMAEKVLEKKMTETLEEKNQLSDNKPGQVQHKKKHRGNELSL